MPIYEYECDHCGHRFERMQRFSDPRVRKCPECGKHKVQRLISPPAIRFKGSGWYVTDYANKGKPAKKGEGEAASNKKKNNAEPGEKAGKDIDTSKDNS